MRTKAVALTALLILTMLTACRRAEKIHQEDAVTTATNQPETHATETATVGTPDTEEGVGLMTEHVPPNPTATTSTESSETKTPPSKPRKAKKRH